MDTKIGAITKLKVLARFLISVGQFFRALVDKPF